MAQGFPEAYVLKVANSAYEAVRLWLCNHGEKDLPPWDEADEQTRRAVMDRVSRIQSDPNLGDATFHNEWMAFQERHGWSYSPVFDEKRKTDPLLRPFHLLPPEQKTKERMFRAVVKSASGI